MLEEAKASVEALVTEVMAVPTDTIYSSFEALVHNMQAVGIEQVRGTTRCVTISMKYFALAGLERFDWH